VAITEGVNMHNNHNEAFERSMSSPGSAAYAVAMALLQEVVKMSVADAHRKAKEKVRCVSVGSCKHERK
jgi:hypothetical protein